MKEVSTSILIQASPACVWRVLTDFDSYREWLAEAPYITGRLEEGSTLVLTAESAGAAIRTYRLLLRKVTVEKELCWSLNAPASRLFGSERHFVIKPLDEGNVEFVQAEVFSSLISALSALVSFRGIRQAMGQMNLALKERAEQLEKQLAAETTDTTVWPPPIRK